MTTTRARRAIVRSFETHLLCNSRNFAADPGGWPPTEASFDASRSAMAVARRRVASARRVADAARAIGGSVDRSSHDSSKRPIDRGHVPLGAYATDVCVEGGCFFEWFFFGSLYVDRVLVV